MFAYAVHWASVHLDHVSAMEVLAIDDFIADSAFIDILTLAVSVYPYCILLLLQLVTPNGVPNQSVKKTNWSHQLVTPIG